MAEVAGNDDSPSWLKQRSNVFNTTAEKPKVVDKELARLKNIGAVSSVWTNKFVQEDSNSGGRRPSYTSQKSPSPTSETFNTRIRTLSGNKKMADDITLLLQSSRKSADFQQQQHKKQQSSASSVTSRFSKTSMSSLDLNEVDTRSSLVSFTGSEFLPSPTSTEASKISIKDDNKSEMELLKTQYDALLDKANQDVEFYKQQLAQESQKKQEIENAAKDEAARLWFQSEALKTQFAQTEARLKKANEDLESYKEQLLNHETSNIEESQVVQVRQLVEIIVKQDKLLNEYENSLNDFTELSNHMDSPDTRAEIDNLHQELALLKNQKENMQSTITALRAELDMSHSQMKLMMVVSTEIQNEFESFKERKEAEIRELLSQKEYEHRQHIKSIEQSFVLPSQDSFLLEQIEGLKSALEMRDKKEIEYIEYIRSIEQTAFQDPALYSQIDQLKAELDAKDKKETEYLEHIKSLEQKLQDTNLLDQINQLKAALEEKEMFITNIQHQLRSQRMSMDAQMMELTESILEKDTLLMEFMSGRNGSRETIAQSQVHPLQPQQQQPNELPKLVTSTVAPVNITHSFYHPEEEEDQENTPRIQISQVREFIYSESEDNNETDDDSSEILVLNYSTDDEREVRDNFEQRDYYRHLNNLDNEQDHQDNNSQRSSVISFESSDGEQEEKVAEIKRLSYSSAQSTRPVSLISTTESLSGIQEENPLQISNEARFNNVKETASWPIPPPTPPPSEPLPPVPSLNSNSISPPSRFPRTKPIVREESNESTTFSPLQMQSEPPIPPPRKAHLKINPEQTSENWKDGIEDETWRP